MKLFNRGKQDNSQLPQEVKEYYQSERRERTGFAWLLGLGTLLATIAVAALLFLGGRWVYRTVFDKNDDKAQPVATQQQSEGTQQKTGQDRNNQNATGDQKPPASGGAPAAGTGEPTGPGAPQQNGGATNSAGNTNGASTPSTPVTGETQLINTGPDDE